MTAEPRQRFLRAIAERIPLERIEEVHLFPPMRQGGKESGVAVVMVRREGEGEAEVESAADAVGPADDAAEESPDAELQPAEVERVDADALEAFVSDDPAPDGEEPVAPPQPPPRRFTVFGASYRLVLKGPDRGKWEVAVTEEADAPAYTVDEVVRGVHERAGGSDEPERLTGEMFRAALVEEPWTAAR